MMPSAVVTGGTKRIGLALSQCLIAAGYAVFGHSRTTSAASESLPGLQTHPDLTFDFDDPDVAERRFSRFLENKGRVDTLVLNAGMFEPDHAAAINGATLDRMLRANLTAQLRLMRAFIEHTASARSEGSPPATIIVLLDQKLLNPNPDFFSYTITKYGLAGAIDLVACAGERVTGVHIYGLAPGLTLPSHDQTSSEFDISSRMNLLTRQNTPQELGEACVFLTRGMLRNGTVLLCDSGQHLIAQPRDVMYEIRKNHEI